MTPFAPRGLVLSINRDNEPPPCLVRRYDFRLQYERRQDRLLVEFLLRVADHVVGPGFVEERLLHVGK